MDTALVISLNFHPGHVSHLVAIYKQMQELGYNSTYCVADGFVSYLPKGSRICIYGKDCLPDASVAIFVFPSERNLLLTLQLKKRGSKIVYIFHEPLAPMREYRKAGFSYKYLIKLWIVNQISRVTVKWSDIILLPSQKAMEFYRANPIYKNQNYHYLPLMYGNERTDEMARVERRYFAYIGTVAADHSFTEYLRFVEYAVKNDKLKQLSFLIATKSEFDVPQSLAESSRVVIHKGKPLSDVEINEYYASTYVVWNAYTRTTQSGVLAKAFMFGTPAIVLKKNLSEFTEDGYEVVAIDDNTSFEEIEKGVVKIVNNFNCYSDKARKRFEESFYYKQYNDFVESILSCVNKV